MYILQYYLIQLLKLLKKTGLARSANLPEGLYIFIFVVKANTTKQQQSTFFHKFKAQNLASGCMTVFIKPIPRHFR